MSCVNWLFLLLDISNYSFGLSAQTRCRLFFRRSIRHANRLAKLAGLGQFILRDYRTGASICEDESGCDDGDSGYEDPKTRRSEEPKSGDSGYEDAKNRSLATPATKTRGREEPKSGDSGYEDAKCGDLGYEDARTRGREDAKSGETGYGGGFLRFENRENKYGQLANGNLRLKVISPVVGRSAHT